MILPPETPVTTPVVGLIVARVVSLIPHVPPFVASVTVMLFPTQTFEVTALTAETPGFAVTEIVIVAALLQGVVPNPIVGFVIVYMILAVPAETAVTTPDALTLATAVLELLQTAVPPVGIADALKSCVTCPTHKAESAAVDETNTGTAFIVNLLFATLGQPLPLDTIYCITALPAETPVTKPLLSTVAIAVLSLDQVPPDTVLVNVEVLPAHKVATPVVNPAPGPVLTFTV